MPDLDGIRGALALCVVLLHFGINSFTQRALGWDGFAFELCVDVFFILSGFVLASSYFASANRSFGRFAVKRFFRLAPVFYVTTLMVILIGVPAGPLELIMAVPLAGRQPANFPAWSITFEFYWPLAAFAAAPFVPLPARLRLPALALCLVIHGVLCVLVAQDADAVYGTRAPFGLLAGALLYRVYTELPPRAGSPAVVWGLFGLLMALFALAPAVPAAAFAVPALAAALVVAAARTRTLFATPPAQWLGAQSYTIYMIHIPVLWAMQRLGGPAIDSNPAAKLAGLVVVLVGAAVLTRLVELPGIALGTQLLARPAQPKSATRSSEEA